MKLSQFKNRIEMIRSFPRGGNVVELGVCCGWFSDEIIKHAAPNRLWLVDIWAWTTPDKGQVWGWEQPEHQKTGDQVYIHNIRRFLDNPAIQTVRAPSRQAVHAFPDDFLDWVYIDADHHYEEALFDIANWSKKVRPGGIVAGHDFNQEQVAKALKEIEEENPHWEINLTDEPNSSFWFVKT